MPAFCGYHAYLVNGFKGALRENHGQKQRKTFSSLVWLFLFVRNLDFVLWELLWHLWSGGAKHPGLGNLELEVLNTDGSCMVIFHLRLKLASWLLLSTDSYLLGQNEWSRLRQKGIHSVWPVANQDLSYVATAGVGIVSLWGVHVTLPTYATAQSQKFQDQEYAMLLCSMLIKMLTKTLSSLG